MTIQQAITILGIELPTSPQAIKKSYREQAKLWHPDNFRIYEQQIDAGHRFIEIKQAYDFLLTVDMDSLNRYRPGLDDDIVRRNRRAEDPAYNNDLRIFHTPIFREAQNIFSLFYLFSKWDWFGVPAFIRHSYHKTNQYIKPHNDGLGPAFARLFLFVLILFGAVVFVAVSLPLFFFGALLFIPFMWLYIKSVKGLTQMAQKLLGYVPAPNCGHLRGELAYLFIRTLMPLLLVIGGLIILTKVHISPSGWLLIIGYPAFLLLITTSILYEWISFIRVQSLRTKINAQI